MKALIFAERKQFESPDESMKNLRRNLKVNNILIEEVDISSATGSERASTYDVMSFPALALIREDGAVQDIWQNNLPDYGLISQSVGHV